VNGRVTNIPSFMVKQGDIVTVREKSKSLGTITESLSGFNHTKYSWLEWEDSIMGGKFLNTPLREEIPENIKEQLIVELYSKN
jgi:small subunit ribosomal protein S4